MRDDCRAEDWRMDALCAQRDPEWWFPTSIVEHELALMVCDVCKVQEPCLKYAKQTHQAHGIWGGVDMQSRYSSTDRRSRLDRRR